VVAQEDSTALEFQKQFEQFKSSIQQDFEHFKSKNDSIFYRFLTESWKSFKLMKDERSEAPKPKVQPKIEKVKREEIEISPLKKKSIDLENKVKKPVFEGKAMEFNSKNVFREEEFTCFDFYGDEVEIPKEVMPVTSVEGAMNRKIATFFKKSSNNDKLLATIDILRQKAIDKKLNGWGYYNLIKEAAAKVRKSLDDQILFSWFALLKSGYDVRIGYDRNDVYLLVNFDVPVYYSSYFELNGSKYYIVLFEGQRALEKRVNSYRGDYPGNLESLSLYMPDIPELAVKEGKRTVDFLGNKIELDYNRNLIDFYETYPECDLSVYFPVRLSSLALHSLDRFLKKEMERGTDLQKLDYLLKFVQYAVKYETDEEQFGAENYLFAEETLFFPYADCEDRVILLSQLVDHYLGLKSLALLYDGHVSYAVKVDDKDVEGAYVLYNGEKYYIADPTYIGASVGMVMDHYRFKKPEILVLN
jgi:hypothetical protein